MTNKANTEADQIQLVEKLEEMEADLSLMLREGHEITTAKGEKLKIPAITGTAEKEAIKIIIGYLREHSDIIEKLKGGKINREDILSFVIDASDDGYDEVQKFAGAIIGKDVKWVNNNLLIADFINIISPFVRAEKTPIVKAIKKNLMMATFGQKIKETMETASTT